MIPAKLLAKTKRIRVQMMFWTAALLLLAIAGPRELLTYFDAQYYQSDLIDRSTALVNDVAANLGEMSVLDEQDVENQLLKEVVQVPALEELSVFENTPGADAKTRSAR